MTPPSDNQPMAAPICDHHWASHHYGGRSMTVCTLCHRPNLDDLDRQTAEARAEGERAATERIAAFIEERASMLDDEMSAAVPANTTGLDRQRAVIDALYRLDVDIRAAEHLESATSGTVGR